ncbi:MAG: TrkH family potassium uptake protein [Oscillospiraceae bacterium]|nr:TrkH family potassium uptake protein [Oscillospiraceae bacterium]
MNFRMTIYVLGILLAFEGVFFGLPALTAGIYGEKQVWLFLALALFCLIGGFLIASRKPKNRNIFARDGFVIVALSWIVMSFFGALPFYISGCIPQFVDALFESVSGFTTTGASILSDLDSMPKSMIMWRSFTHWIGGMGVLVFIMAILPLSGASNMHIMRAESPGPSVSKLVPRVKNTAMLLYIIYIFLTLFEVVLLWCGEMNFFEAVNVSFATAGTGGFSINNAGMAGTSAYSQIVATVFMILFGINFTSYFLLLTGKFREAFNTELRVFLLIIAAAIISISINVHQMFSSLGETVRHVSFTVGSIITTTGFSTADFNLWPAFSKTVLVLLMFIGACAGSTGGGIKVSRFLILGKSMRNQFRTMLHPRQVRKVRLDGRQIESETIRTINAYLFCYILICIVSMLVISLDGFDLTTNFTSVAATLNNIGPGLSRVGPTENFALFSPLSKGMLIFNMLAGRLEIFPMILLISPMTWKK